MKLGGWNRERLRGLTERRSRDPEDRRREAAEAADSVTPILVPPRVMAAIIVVGIAVFALVLYAAPTVPLVAIGGVALAIVLSFPVRALSHVMPRGLAILVTVLALVGLISLAFFFLVPILIEQLRNLAMRTPAIAGSANGFLMDAMRFLGERQLLPGESPDEFGREIVRDLFGRARDLTENLLGSLLGFIPRVFNFAIALFGVLFIAVYLLVDVRKVKAAYLRAAPHRYRRDARQLWDAFGVSLSRYLGGLVFVALVQGTLAGVALYVLNVPFALLLGVWVSLTAIIPYLGAFLGGIPAVILAFFQSPTTGILTLVVYIMIQQLEGNLLTPRVQGHALQVHPIIVLLAVIAGGQLGGIAGIVFAVPALAVFRVFFDFFRLRLRATPNEEQ